MKDKGRLLTEFQAPSLEQWRAEVERLLKGAPFARKMFTTTLEGIEVGSMSTAADRPDPDWTDTLPGQSPLLRGSRIHRGPWWVAQEIPLPSAADFNSALNHDLGRGQTAVNLIVEGAGPRGTVIRGLDDLRTALLGVDLGEVPVLIQSGGAHFQVAGNLLDLAREQGLDSQVLRGRVGCDPVAGLAVEGELSLPSESLYDQLAELTLQSVQVAPGLNTLPVFEDPWHDGGADGALGLGLVLAAAVQALREMESRGVPVAKAAARIHFNLCVGSDFFLEISRLRTLRVLWSRILTACGVDPVTAPPQIHARTSSRTATVLDAHVNMLRATTQAMSAVLGGVDSLHVVPFDEPLGPPDDFSRRIARNVQLVLAYECQLDQVIDPAGGSWYVEKLTSDIGARTWRWFQEIEAAGGALAAWTGGKTREWVNAAAGERASRLASRREVLVGTNQYPDPNPLPDFQAEVFEGKESAIVPRRDAEPFEVLRGRVEKMAIEDASAGRVFCACLGDVARYMPRLEFTRRFFRVGGFEVTGDGFTTSAGEAVAAARADGARTVVLVGLDETYAELAAEVASALKNEPDPPVVMLAGQPVDGALIDETIGVKSNVLDVLERLATWVGGVS